MAKWILSEETSDGYEHHKCSNCGKLALYDYIMQEDWDEGMDGEWSFLGIRENGVNEHMTKFCPNCGEKMDYEETLHYMYGCKICTFFDSNSCNYGYTDKCEDCGEYPWAKDELPSKWEPSLDKYTTLC